MASAYGRSGEFADGSFGAAKPAEALCDWMAASGRSRRAAWGRNDSSASGRYPEANLERQLSGDESEEPSVATR